MDGEEQNPCATCITHQHCCRELEDLRLTPGEYKRHFLECKERLSVRQKGPVFKVSVRPGHACPHWKDGCAVYDERSRECRLFPYGIGALVVFRRRVLLTFHAYDSGCPNLEALRMPREQARELVTTFATEAFGEAYRVTIIHEPLILHKAFNVARVLVWRIRQAVSRRS